LGGPSRDEGHPGTDRLKHFVVGHRMTNAARAARSNRASGAVEAEQLFGPERA
jgi:hypothetical protein